MPILAFFLLMPVIEIALFILAGSIIGFWSTIGLALATSVLGVMMLRAQKAVTMAELRRAEATFSDPSAPLARMALRQVSGMLLVLPGFLTDAFALLLLVPFVRRLMLKGLSKRFKAMPGGFGAQFGGAGPAGAGFGGPGFGATGFGASGFGAQPGPMRDRPQGDVVIDGEAVEITDATALPRDDRRPPSGWTQG